ncbi:hypothetical protein GF374_03235 [Candidatus Woesearchaeota archaeon]|nr:hypothetical protein [Candidatus Woesearchaeota archaeon]
MVKRPESVHFHKPTTKTLYYSLLLVNIAVLVLFGYIIYLIYFYTAETELFKFGYLFIGLAVLAVVFLSLLLVMGKKGLSKKLLDFKKYKHHVKH